MPTRPAINLAPRADGAPDHRSGAGFTLALALIAVIEDCGVTMAELPPAPAGKARTRRGRASGPR